MSFARKLTNSFDDYLAIERDSSTRHEFIGGEIYAMAGGTLEHAALAFQSAQLLSQSLKNCVGLSSDARIHIESHQMLTYPDVAFACAGIEKSTIDIDAIINPTLIVEVTSKTTEAYDRTQKLAAYKTIPSLKVVMFVSHREQRVTVVERAGNEWTTREFMAGQIVRAQTLPAELSVDELYSVLGQFR